MDFSTRAFHFLESSASATPLSCHPRRDTPHFLLRATSRTGLGESHKSVLTPSFVVPRFSPPHPPTLRPQLRTSPSLSQVPCAGPHRASFPQSARRCQRRRSCWSASMSSPDKKHTWCTTGPTCQQATQGHHSMAQETQESQEHHKTTTRSMTTATRTATSPSNIREMTLLFAGDRHWTVTEFAPARFPPRVSLRPSLSHKRAKHKLTNPLHKWITDAGCPECAHRITPSLEQPELSSSQESATHVPEIQKTVTRRLLPETL